MDNTLEIIDELRRSYSFYLKNKNDDSWNDVQLLYRKLDLVMFANEKENNSE